MKLISVSQIEEFLDRDSGRLLNDLQAGYVEGTLTSLPISIDDIRTFTGFQKAILNSVENLKDQLLETGAYPVRIRYVSLNDARSMTHTGYFECKAWMRIRVFDKINQAGRVITEKSV